MRQVRWSGIPISKNFPQFVVTHMVKGFSIVNEAEIFLEFSCFFYEPSTRIIHMSCVLISNKLFKRNFLLEYS